MRYLFLFLFVMLVSCQGNETTTIETDIMNEDYDTIGKASISEDPDGVKVEVSVEGLSPGFHGIHIHEFPQCEAPTFETAGNHWNIDDSKHGLMHPEGNHIGDMPNLEVDSDGSATYEYVIPEATLKDGRGSMFSDGGKALIIHDGMDDGVSQPAGDSGTRIACAIITRDTEPTKGENPGEDVEEEEEEES